MKKRANQLGAWLDLLGEDKAYLSRRLGLSDRAIGVAIIRGDRSPWLADLAKYLGVPVEMLISEDPLSPSPEVRKVRREAILTAAHRRLRPKRACLDRRRLQDAAD